MSHLHRAFSEHSRILRAALIAVLFVSIIGCVGPFDGSGSQQETVTIPISVQFGGPELTGSTIAPDVSVLQNQITSYVLSGKLQDQTNYTTLTSLSNLENATVEISVGTWDLKLEAKAGDTAVLAGSLTGQQISSNSDGDSVQFVLRPLEAGNGSLNLTVTLPEGHPVSAVEGSLAGSTLGSELSLNTGDSPQTVTIAKSGIPAGDHLLSITFKDAGGAALGTLTEVVWIRPNITTLATATLSLEDLYQQPGKQTLNLSATVEFPTPTDIILEPSPDSRVWITPGETITVSAEAENTTVSSWQWYVNGELQENQTSNTVSIDTGSLLGQVEVTAVATVGGRQSSARTRFVVSNEPSREWTILLYLNGDNDLEPYAIGDVNEAEYGMYEALKKDSNFLSRVAMVVQFDRYDGSDNNTAAPTEEGGGDWTDTRRYLIKPDSDSNEDGLFTSQRLDASGQETGLGEKNMGDAAVLKEFVEWGKENYPARRYALIIWNHGDGVRTSSDDQESGLKAVSWDHTNTVNGSADTLYVGEITNVLTDAESVDLLGMDACLMGMAEAAYEYRSGVSGKFGADYYVASVPTEPGDGWEYDHILIRMAGADIDGDSHSDYSGAGITPDELSRILVEEYADRYSSTANASLSAIDTRKLNIVRTALDSLAEQIGDTDGGLSKEDGSLGHTIQFDIRGAHNGTMADNQSYGGSGPVTMNYFGGTATWNTSWRYNPHFDLYDFAERLHAADIPEAVKSSAESVKSGVAEAVVTSWGGSGYDGKAHGGDNFEPGNHGLGIFFPAADYVNPDGGNTAPDFSWQYFYTNLDVQSIKSNLQPTGNLDFLTGFDKDQKVEGWLELLHAWYDPQGCWVIGGDCSVSY